MMRIPVIKGIIERRILVNFRVDAEALARSVPPPFRVRTVDGFGMAGICLIRLRAIRPRFVPAFLGIRSENAAHRIAVEWQEGGEIRTGVYVPRRDTSSTANFLLGGRLFPGEHHRARFEVKEEDGSFDVALESDDGTTRLDFRARVGSRLAHGSVFDSLEEASRFFEEGSLGYSATSTPGLYDGLELKTFGWRVEPLEVSRVESTFFDDRGRFPEGSVKFDCALLMRNLQHEWHGLESVRGACCLEPEASGDRVRSP
jgi:hypothetical protein